MQKVAPMLLILIAALVSGCATTGKASKGLDAAGYYTGNWYAANPDKPLGVLNCTITSTGKETWNAVFFATFGGVGEYEVELAGITQGETIVFEGSVDLGETSGGVFDWKGTITGEQFLGDYTSKFINGTFKMQKTEAPADQ